jgi:hypothetical protein
LLRLLYEKLKVRGGLSQASQSRADATDVCGDGVVIDRLRTLKAGHIDGMPGTGAVLSFGVGAVEVELLKASRLMFGGDLGSW